MRRAGYLVLGAFTGLAAMVAANTFNAVRAIGLALVLASTGPANFANAAGVALGGDNSWANVNNALASDNAYSTVAVSTTDPNGYSNGLRLGNPSAGLSIPAGATIDGIVVEIERKSSLSNVLEDREIYLIRNGTGSTNKASATAWPTTDTYATYGGSTDLWGLTWTSSDFGSNLFLRIQVEAIAPGSATASVDHGRITVYYTAANTRRRASMVLTG